MRAARGEPRTLVIGVDTNESGMRETSRRAAKLPNGLFLVADARDALEALSGLVHQLRITLPWGSLLRLVLEGEREFALAVAGAL